MTVPSPSLRDLLTILYRPRETMRRILDSGPDRWSVQMVVLAFFCTQVNDPDLRRLGEVIPGLQPLILSAIALFGMIVLAAVWVLVLFVMSWLVSLAGRFFGGAGSVADVRAAIAWSFAPAIWSVVVRIPIAIYQARYHIPTRVQGKEAILNFLAHGGCALAVAVVAIQIVLFAAWLFITSCTVAEAQRFSTAKGFGNIAVAFAGPFVVCIAAVFAFRH